jgi:hypothetical protein
MGYNRGEERNFSPVFRGIPGVKDRRGPR